MEQKTENKRPHEQYYKDMLCMGVPLVFMSCYFYGVRPLALCVFAVLLGNLCDRLVVALRRSTYVPGDYSSEAFALLVALLLPASVHWYVLTVAVLACVLLGKEAFGGYGSYPFHPAAVGYVVAAISWPSQVFLYPQIHTQLPIFMTDDVTLLSGISGTLKNGGLPIISTEALLLGNYPGQMGTVAALVILACALFLLARRDIDFVTPFMFLATCALIVFFFPRQQDLVGPIMETIDARMHLLKYELLSGAMLYGVVFLVCEPFTCPKYWGGRTFYGILLGFVTMMFRYYGVYEAGICFALLSVNSLSGWLDRVSFKALFHTGVSKVKIAVQTVDKAQAQAESYIEQNWDEAIPVPDTMQESAMEAMPEPTVLESRDENALLEAPLRITVPIAGTSAVKQTAVDEQGFVQTPESQGEKFSSAPERQTNKGGENA